ncbi:hypothetical protein [Peredibacter starrii]|uniref:RiboL-PSP-HEPN domain-containing protein n=1 Tax=Peredibacter starrii TaxID=28202 RepID=A0AAX4HK57_9BACT|nr:hypothetical protein [Peredibacter starrii]WPU63589.1 hypothetical protein SOO65_12905 [Peredibacter starrii]
MKKQTPEITFFRNLKHSEELSVSDEANSYLLDEKDGEINKIIFAETIRNANDTIFHIYDQLKMLHANAYANMKESILISKEQLGCGYEQEHMLVFENSALGNHEILSVEIALVILFNKLELIFKELTVLGYIENSSSTKFQRGDLLSNGNLGRYLTAMFEKGYIAEADLALPHLIKARTIRNQFAHGDHVNKDDLGNLNIVDVFREIQRFFNNIKW